MLNELRGLINTLQDPALDATDPAVRQQIVDTLGALDEAHGRVMGSITELGGRQNALTLLTDSNEDVSLVNQKIEGELSRLDYAGATIDLNDYQLALGATQNVVIKAVTWKAARAGIVTGVLLAVARISGETAPLLFTALNNNFMSSRILEPMASLPAVIFQYALSPYADWHSLAWGGALLITLTVLALSIVARLLEHKRT